MFTIARRIGSAAALVAGLVVSLIFPDKSRDDSDYWETATDVDFPADQSIAA